MAKPSLLKIALVISIVVAIGTSYLAFQFRDKMHRAIAAAAEAHTTSNQNQAALNERYQQLSEVQDLLAKLENKDAATQAQLSATKANLNNLKDQLSQLQSQLEARDTHIQQLTIDLQTKDEQIQQLNQAREADAKAVASIQTLQDAITERDAVIAKLEQDIRARQAEVEKARALQESFQQAQANIPGRVLAVNQAWNFIVISLGNQNGMQPNTELKIKRGETFIGKARITSVEPTTSIAEILPYTIQSGFSIEPGDFVSWN